VISALSGGLLTVLGVLAIGAALPGFPPVPVARASP